jgi:hypothetical protein
MDLGHLVGQHVRIARLEVSAELQIMSRRARLFGVLAAMIGVGYSLAMAGLAVVVAGSLAVGLSLVVTGLAHVLIAGAGLIFAPGRARALPAAPAPTSVEGTDVR